MLIFDATEGGGTQFQYAQFTNPNPTGQITRLATIPESCRPWLDVLYKENLGRDIGVQVTPALVPGPGTYPCSIAINQSTGGQGVLQVILNVGNSGLGNTPNGIASPTVLRFPRGQGLQRISVNASGNVLLSATTPSTYQTLGGNEYQPTFSLDPGAHILSVTAPTSIRDDWNAILYLETPSGTERIQVVGSPSPLVAEPATFNLEYHPGGSVPFGELLVTLPYSAGPPVTISTSANWIRLTNPTTNGSPASFRFTVDPSMLPNGLNSATIVAKTPSAAALTIPVAVMVTGSSVNGGRTMQGPSFLFTAIADGPPPASQEVNIGGWLNLDRVSGSGLSPSSYTAVTATQTGVPAWLGITPVGQLDLAAAPNLTVTVNQRGLALGTYSGTITLSSGRTKQVIPVMLAVVNGPKVVVTPAGLNFTYQVGGSLPAPQQYAISVPAGAPPMSVAIAAQTNSGGDWLSAGGSSATISTSTNFNASVTPGNLAPGTYQGSITVTPSVAAPVSIPVTLTILAATISATPATVSFSYSSGGAIPTPQAVRINGPAGQTFAAKITSGGGWLSVSPSSGSLTGDSSLSLAVNPAGLNAATYSGSVSVESSSGASVAIPVSLVVSAALPTIDKVANSASYSAGTISAGEIITIFGRSLGPDPGIQASAAGSDQFPARLGGVEVLVGGYPAPLIYAGTGQVSAVVPYEIASPYFDAPSVLVKYLGQTSNAVAVKQAGAVPGIFTADSSGKGQGAILNSDYSANNSGNPAARGDIVQVFITGEGQTAPAGATGKITKIAASGPLTPQPILPLSVTIDGAPAAILFYGEAPELVAGIMQLNVRIPADIIRVGDLPIVITMGTGNAAVPSQTGVTVSVR